MKTKKEELQAELTRLNALRKQVKEKLKALRTYEMNRWYKHPNGSLYFINNECDRGNLYGYGFNKDGDWSVRNNDDSRFCAFNSVAKKEITLASREEVEQALIEEAKRRYKVGDKLSKVYDEFSNGSRIFSHELHFTDNMLWLSNDGDYYSCIFTNGKWATIIEQDKFAELKEAHRNGAVIQYYNNFLKTWSDVYQNKPTWDKQERYRIKPEELESYTELLQQYNTIGNKIKELAKKASISTKGEGNYEPEEKPKVGDVVKLNSTQVALIKNEHEAYRWRFCTKLTRQEAIDLLFNKGAN